MVDAATLEQLVDVVGDVVQAPVLGAGESAANSCSKNASSPSQNPSTCEQHDRVAVVAELLEGQHLEQLLEGPEAARQRHERVGAGDHLLLAAAHVSVTTSSSQASSADPAVDHQLAAAPPSPGPRRHAPRRAATPISPTEVPPYTSSCPGWPSAVP